MGHRFHSGGTLRESACQEGAKMFRQATLLPIAAHDHSSDEGQSLSYREEATVRRTRCSGAFQHHTDSLRWM